MKIKIGIAGSGKSEDEYVLKISEQIGVELAKRDCIVITGAGGGVPYEVAKAAKKEGCMVVGISPASNIKEHEEKYNFPVKYFDVLLFSGFGLKGRNVIFVRSCDGIILISGGSGTLNEFTIAYDEGKVIGVAKGTQGISDSIMSLSELNTKRKEKIIFEDEPRILVDKIIECLKRKPGSQH
jgi:uncharacterized protein (TIGR00725 family)